MRVFPPTGKLEPTAQTMNALTRALPPGDRNLLATEGTIAVISPGTANRPAERIARDTEAKAPFPRNERKALAAALIRVGKESGFFLKRQQDYVTADGRFASQLGFDITTVPEAGSGREVERALTKIVEAAPGWSAIAGGRLLFKTKLQLNALKGLGTAPLSGDDKKLLGLTTPPKGAALTACAKGCASLIRSGNIARPEGKKEAAIIIEAAGNADAALGKQLKVAVEEKKGQFEFTITTLQNLDNALASLPGRLSAAISSLQSPNDQTLKIVERFFKPNENSPFSDFSDSRKVAQKLLGTLKRVERQLGFVDRKKFIPRLSLNPIKVVEAKFKDSSVVAVAYFGNIYLDQSRFNSHNPVTHAAVVLHETVHLALSARAEKEDFRYIWQGVEGLSADDAINNADSIVAFVFHDLLGAIGRYTVPRP